MEHTWAKFVRSILTPFGLGSLIPGCRTGEIEVATHPELLDRPASSKAKEARGKRGPSVAELKAKVERAAKRGPDDRPDIGMMSHAERDKILYGI